MKIIKKSKKNYSLKPETKKDFEDMEKLTRTVEQAKKGNLKLEDLKIIKDLKNRI